MNSRTNNPTTTAIPSGIGDTAALSLAEPRSLDRSALLPWTHAATLAPSPDNNQPWRFEITGQSIDVFLDRARALPSDVHSLFDLTAIGAAVENCCIAARASGYRPTITIDHPHSQLSAPSALTRIANICFEADANGDALSNLLTTRHTSRAAYSTQPVDDQHLRGLAEAVGSFPEVQLHWIRDRSAIRQCAWLIGRSDRLRFERQAFHSELFRQLRFTPAEAQATRDGLDLRTLGLPPFGSLTLRAISNWNVLNAMNFLGASRMLSMPSVMSVLCSGAIGLLTIPRADCESLVGGGRAFQRLWLALSGLASSNPRSGNQKLQLHPLGSLPIFLAHWDQLHGRELTPSQQRLAQRIKRDFIRLVPTAADRVLQIAFRIGYGPASPCRSLRRDAHDVLAEPGLPGAHPALSPDAIARIDEHAA